VDCPSGRFGRAWRKQPGGSQRWHRCLRRRSRDARCRLAGDVIMMRRSRSVLAVAALVLLPGLAACGGGSQGGPAGLAPTAPPATVSGAPVSPAPSGTPSPSSPSTPPFTAPSAAPRTPTPTSQMLRTSGWTSETLTVQQQTDGTARLVEVRSAHHTEGTLAYDRLVFEFTGAVPGYTVRYVPEVVSPGQGAVVPLAGQAFLEVVFYPAAAHNDLGSSTLRTSASGGGLPALVQYRMSRRLRGIRPLRPWRRRPGCRPGHGTREPVSRGGRHRRVVTKPAGATSATTAVRRRPHGYFHPFLFPGDRRRRPFRRGALPAARRVLVQCNLHLPEPDLTVVLPASVACASFSQPDRFDPVRCGRMAGCPSGTTGND